MVDGTALKQYNSPTSTIFQERKGKRLLRFVALFAGLTTLTLTALYYYPSSHAQQVWRSLGSHYTIEPVERCVSSAPAAASPPVPVNLWSSLSVSEALEIRKWLGAPSRYLNLTASVNPAANDNHIFGIEAYRPPKAQSLAYLNSPTTVPRPKRFAKVIIHHGATPQPIIKEYLVGPLPVGPTTEMSELKGIYHRDDIPYNARVTVPATELGQLVGGFMHQMAEATRDLFGAVAYGLPNDTLVAAASAPFSFDGSFRRMWISWKRNVPGSWLHPVDFYQYVEASGADPSQWKLLKIVYNDQIFPTVDSFLDAFYNGTLKRRPHSPEQGKDDSWSSRKRVGPPPDLDHLPGPRSVSFAGLRFRVDRELQYISWMGWGLYLGFNRDMGLSLWDVRLRGERIIYELSPQEAISQYAGHDPLQGTTAWLDSHFGMGTLARDLLPGYDCPHEAIFLPATVHTALGSSTRERAICVFEQDTGRPLTRHLGYLEGEFGAVKGYALTIRSISTVGKYFEYIFQIDGTIEVKLSASGYLQGGFWDDQHAEYGARIHDTSMGNLHDHIINYKVDLDIVGQENSLLHTSTSQEEVERPWLEEDWGKTVIQQKITREYITNEDSALLKYPPNLQGGYAFVNKDAKNRWGYPRGYAIHAGMNPIHNAVVGSKRLLKNAQWARYNLAVSRRKETEPSSSNMWNLHLPGAPVVDFHKFFDSEDITQEDLVAWINVGTHHLPQAEDTPNTRTNLATSSFFLTPLNYFNYDISIDSSNAILLSTPKDAGGPFTFDDYGVKPKNCLPNPVPAFEYSGMKSFGTDGNIRSVSVEEMRREAEAPFRIRMEL
ncbi:amine oxidase catalytic domain-containing protein [Gautieria morchelliformis]|nr:amine oxidase catalytic domain-containing protein [Gautieria morchelliformis]